MDSAEEHKCMVRLMKMALGFTEKAAEAFLSPTKNGAAVEGATEDQGELEVVEEEIIYENEEYLIEELIE